MMLSLIVLLLKQKMWRDGYRPDDQIFTNMKKNLASIKNVLFDMDGTLTDPKEGITRCLQYAMDNLKLPCPETAELHIHIGPPIRHALSIIMKTEDEVLIE